MPIPVPTLLSELYNRTSSLLQTTDQTEYDNMSGSIPAHQLNQLLLEMNSTTFDNNFWTLDYKTGYSVLTNALESVGLKKLEAMAQFYKIRAELEDKFCHSLHETYLARKDKFLIFDKDGNLEKEDKLISSFQSSITIIDEMENEARIRKRYSVSLLNDIILPLNQFIKLYKKNVQSEDTKIVEKISMYEACKKNYLSAKSQYITRARELHKFPTYRILESLKLFENFDKERKLKLLDKEPLNYVISPDLEMSRSELIDALKGLISNVSKTITIKKFLKKSTKKVTANGHEITNYLVNSISIPQIDSIAKAELFGQFLIENDLLFYMTSSKTQQFANIPDWHFEWLLKAFDLCDLKPPFEVPLTSNGTIDSDSPTPPQMISPSSTTNTNTKENSDPSNTETDSSTTLYSAPTELIKKLTSYDSTGGVTTIKTTESADEFLHIKELKLQVDELENAYMTVTIELDELRSDLEKALFQSFHLLNSLEFERLILSKRFIESYIDLTFKTSPEKINKYKNYNSTNFFQENAKYDELQYALVQLKELADKMDIKKDLAMFIDEFGTGHYLSKVETFAPFQGKKVIQMFGTDLLTIIRLEDKPTPFFILELVKSIDLLVSEDLKDVRWWRNLIIDYSTVFNVRLELNKLLRSNPGFFNPDHGVMKREDRKKFELHISKQILSEKHLDDLISENYSNLTFQDLPDKKIIRLSCLFTLLSIYFKQLPESLIPGKFISMINSIYKKPSETSTLLFDTIISKIGENITTLNCLVMLFDTIITATAGFEESDDVYQFLADLFINPLIHPDLDDDATQATVVRLDSYVPVQMIKDLIALKSEILVQMEKVIKQRREMKKKLKGGHKSRKTSSSVSPAAASGAGVPSPIPKRESQA